MALYSLRRILNGLHRRDKKKASTVTESADELGRTQGQMICGEPQHLQDNTAEKATQTHSDPFDEPGPDQVLLIFKVFYVGVKGWPEHRTSDFECHNLPGYPISDVDIQDYQQTPVLEEKPGLLIAITQLLQQEQFQGWFVCHLSFALMESVLMLLSQLGMPSAR